MEFLIEFGHIAVVVMVNDHWWDFVTGGDQKRVVMGF
jgi:hypothetical protein